MILMLIVAGFSGGIGVSGLITGCSASTTPVLQPAVRVADGPSETYGPYKQDLLFDGRLVRCVLWGVRDQGVAAASCDWVSAK